MQEQDLIAAAESATRTLVDVTEAATAWQDVDPDYRRGLIAGVQLSLEQIVRSGEREEMPAELLRPYRLAHLRVTEMLETFNGEHYRVTDPDKAETPTAATVEA